MHTQQEIDAMAEALRAQGLTWGQTTFAVSLVRNAVAAERERCAKLCDDSNIFDYQDPGGFFAKLIRGPGA